VPQAAVPPVPKVAPPAGEVSASKSAADLKKEAEVKKARDKEKGKEEPKP